MLCKWLRGGKKDWEDGLRVRLWVGAALLVAGLAGILCWMFFRERMPDYMAGYYLGGAEGLAAVGLGVLLKGIWLLRHPEGRRKVRIRETDERERDINRSALQLAGTATIVGAGVLSFVVLPFSHLAAKVLAGVVAFHTVFFLLIRVWMARTR